MERMVLQGQIKVGEDVSVISEPPGLVIGLPHAGKDALIPLISRIWSENILSLGRLNSSLTETNLSLISAKTIQGVFVGCLVNESILSFPLAMRVILLASFFITVYLIIFLLFHIRQDNMTVVQNRLKWLQINLIEEYYEHKGKLDLNHWRKQLEQRKGDVFSELKRGIRTKDSGEIDFFIEKAWEDLLAVTGGRMERRADIDEEKLKSILNRFLLEAPSTTPSSTPAIPIQTPPPLPGLEEMEEAEAIDEIEALENVRHESAPIPELTVEEISLESLEVLEELEELPEQEPLEELPPAGDDPPATVEEVLLDGEENPEIVEEVPPAQDEALEIVEEVPPAQDEAPEMVEEVPLDGEEALERVEEVPPDGEEAPEIVEEVPPVEDESLETVEEVLPDGDVALEIVEEVPLDGDENPEIVEEVPPAEDETLETVEEVLPDRPAVDPSEVLDFLAEAASPAEPETIPEEPQKVEEIEPLEVTMEFRQPDPPELGGSGGIPDEVINNLDSKVEFSFIPEEGEKDEDAGTEFIGEDFEIQSPFTTIFSALSEVEFEPEPTENLESLERERTAPDDSPEVEAERLNTDYVKPLFIRSFSTAINEQIEILETPAEEETEHEDDSEETLEVGDEIPEAPSEDENAIISERDGVSYINENILTPDEETVKSLDKNFKNLIDSVLNKG
jgi:hypothetical protein